MEAETRSDTATEAAATRGRIACVVATSAGRSTASIPAMISLNAYRWIWDIAVVCCETGFGLLMGLIVMAFILGGAVYAMDGKPKLVWRIVGGIGLAVSIISPCLLFGGFIALAVCNALVGHPDYINQPWNNTHGIVRTH